MNAEHCIELLCRTSDAPTFARLGFTTITTIEPVNASATVQMTRPGVDDAIVTSLLELRLQGKRFNARIVELNCDLIAEEVTL
jgi:hypothetical protein